MNTLFEQDKASRTLALNSNESFIVQAPAGSGKTELIIQRFLTLLSLAKKPEEILAITFTKKAANEMRTRITKALKQALSSEISTAPHAATTRLLALKVLKRDHELGWNLINNPNQMRIQTIDSLCSYLTKQLPLLSHFGSGIDITDYPTTLYKEAVFSVFLHLEEKNEWSNALSKVLLHLDNDLNKLENLLIDLLAKRDQWLPYINFGSTENEIRNILESSLKLTVSEHLKHTNALFPSDQIFELLAIARFTSANLALNNPTHEMVNYEWNALPACDPHAKKAWLYLANLLLTNQFSWRKRLDEKLGFPAIKDLKNKNEIEIHKNYRKRFNQLLINLEAHENLRQALADIILLPESSYSNNQWEILQALLKTLKLSAAELLIVFQQHGQIDFIENAQAALLALGDNNTPTDLALALDYQIKHILIDEFQDTSFIQYQLIEKLTSGWTANDGRTLFVVGDPMQSIYRFREAEVGLFIRMIKKGIGDLKLTPLKLAINFRSQSTLVEWNNTHFKSIFPKFNDIAKGAVSYNASISIDTESIHNKSITIQGFINDNDAETQGVVTTIKYLLEHYPNENVAVLVRSRLHLAKLIPLLKKNNLNYNAIDIDPLSSRQIIQDLLSLTCALLHPADRISWLSILRAPWCGLNLKDLHVISNQPYKLIWEQIQKEEILTKLSEDGQIRLSKFIKVIKNKIIERERFPLRYWIEETWLLLGGPACLAEDSDLHDIEAFFKLIEELSNSKSQLQIDHLKERIELLYAFNRDEKSNLHIMTIHSAKGLEFDTVILPELNRKPSSDDKSLLQWMECPISDVNNALFIAPIHGVGEEKDSLYEYIHRQQKIKSTYETDRLLYVATTRPKKRLYLFFSVERNNNEGYTIESGSFLSKLWPYLKNQEQEIFTQSFYANLKLEELKNKNDKCLIRLINSWENPYKKLNKDHLILHKNQKGFLRINEKAQMIGTVTHSVLQHIALKGMPWWLNASSDDHQKYIQHQFIQLGLSINEIENAIATVLSGIQKCLHDERGQWILKNHKEARSEFAVTAIVESVVEQIVIDRTFIDENDIRWIIDYKTAVNNDTEFDTFLSQQKNLYYKKLQIYAEAFKHIEKRPIRIGLYFPSLPAWCEWVG